MQLRAKKMSIKIFIAIFVDFAVKVVYNKDIIRACTGFDGDLEV